MKPEQLARLPAVLFEIGKLVGGDLDPGILLSRISELLCQLIAAKTDVVVVCVLKGSVIFLADLVRAMHVPVILEFIGISSYGDATVSSGVVQITQDLSRPVDGKHVIVVEDIVDTGHTVHYLLENLATRRPASMKLAALLHKPERQERAVTIDYLGFTIPNKFVVGYGLDIAQQFRNLPFIGYVTKP